MSGIEYGAPDVYEIVWMSGHVEKIQAHQVSWPNNSMAGLFYGSVVMGTKDVPPRIQFHAEIDGRWVLTLSAIESDLRTVRLVTTSEPIPGDIS